MAKRLTPAPFSQNAFRRAYVAPGVQLVTGTVQEWASETTLAGLDRRRRRAPRSLDPDLLTKPLGLTGEWAVYGIMPADPLTDPTLDAHGAILNSRIANIENFAASAFTVVLRSRHTILHLQRFAAEEYWRRFPKGNENHVFFELVSIDRERRWVVFHMGS